MRYTYDGAAVNPHERGNLIEQLREYRMYLASALGRMELDVPEAGLVALYDEEEIRALTHAREHFGDIKHLILVGIGGSSAGTSAVYEALLGPQTPELHILDVLDAEHLQGLLMRLRDMPLEHLAVAVISKSGTTTETLVNADVLISELYKRYGKAFYRRCVVIGNDATPLMAYAEGRGMLHAPIFQAVGGRFSIFTAAGLLPLSLLGVSITELTDGARKAVEAGLLDDGEPLVSASVLFGAHQNGARINAIFSEDARLHGFVAWYEQLLAESLGKRTGDGGHAGMLPVSMSPRELHSTAELYLSGFPQVFTTFLRIDQKQSAYMVSEVECGSLVTLSGSRSFDRIPRAIMDGVHKAYTHASLPHIVMDVGELSASSLGAFMAERMLEVLYLGKLWNIDVFNQPNVELYKTEARRILQGGVE